MTAMRGLFKAVAAEFQRMMNKVLGTWSDPAIDNPGRIGDGADRFFRL